MAAELGDYGKTIAQNADGMLVRVVSEIGTLVADYRGITVVTDRDGDFVLTRRDGPSLVFPKNNYAITFPKGE